MFYIKYNKLIIGGKGNQYRGRRLAYTESYVKQLRHDVPLKLGRELKTLGQKDLTETTYGPNFSYPKFLDNILNRGGNHRYGARYDPTDIDVYLAPMKELDGGLDDDRDRYNRTLIWDKIWGHSPFQTENKNTSTMTKSSDNSSYEYRGKGYWRTRYACDNIEITFPSNRSHQKNVWFTIESLPENHSQNDRNYGVFSVSMETNAYLYVRSRINNSVSGWHRPTSYANNSVITIKYDKDVKAFILLKGTSEVWREKYTIPKGKDLYCNLGSYHNGAVFKNIKLSNYGPYIFSYSGLNPYLVAI